MLLNNAVLMFIRDGGLNDGKIFKKSGPVYLSIGGSVLLSAIAPCTIWFYAMRVSSPTPVIAMFVFDTIKSGHFSIACSTDH